MPCCIPRFTNERQVHVSRGPFAQAKVPPSRCIYVTGMLKSRLPLVVFASSVGLFLVVGWLSISTDDFGLYHDDGIYVVTARSPAVTGKFRITSLPEEPYQRKYPIVFPPMLFVVWRIAGDFPANII